MLANMETGLQRLMDALNAKAKEFGMKINVKKTKAIVVSKSGIGRVTFL